MLLLHLFLHLWEVHLGDYAILTLLTRNRWRKVFIPSCLMDAAVDKNDVQLRVVLEDFDLLERITVHKDTVSIIAGLDMPEFVLPHEELSDAGGGSNDGFVGCEAEEVLEVREVARVGAMRSPSVAVVTFDRR